MTAKPLNFDVTPGELAASRHPLRMPSIYRGVSWYPQKGKWRAHGSFKRKQAYLGYHETDVEAARAYDTWARKYGRPVNFPSACMDNCKGCSKRDDRHEEDGDYDKDFEESDDNTQSDNHNEERGEITEAQKKRRRLISTSSSTSLHSTMAASKSLQNPSEVCLKDEDYIDSDDE